MAVFHQQHRPSSSSSSSLCRCVLLLLLLLLSAASVDAAVYVVGGQAGWTTPARANVNYTQWAASTDFRVGDTLEFNYAPKAHSVLEVTRTDFRYCNTSQPLATFQDPTGKTIVRLTKSGNYYFIDGVADHCANASQKFQATVSASAASSSSIASSPSSGDFLEPSSSSSSSSPEPSAPAIPPTVGAAPATTTIPLFFLLSSILLPLLHPPFSC